MKNLKLIRIRLQLEKYERTSIYNTFALIITQRGCQLRHCLYGLSIGRRCSSKKQVLNYICLFRY